MAEIEHRRAVRAVLLTPKPEVLLMCAREPASGRRIWFTPGGGLDPDEDPITGLRRELLLVSHICAGGTAAVMVVSRRVARAYHGLARHTIRSIRGALAKMLCRRGMVPWLSFTVGLLEDVRGAESASTAAARQEARMHAGAYSVNLLTANLAVTD